MQKSVTHHSFFLIRQLFWLLLLCAGFSYAQVNPDKLLSNHQAFSAQVFHSGDGLIVEFAVAPDYYLYQDKITFKTDPENILGTAQFSPTKVKQDLYFGEQNVFYDRAQITIPLNKSQQKPFTFVVSFQGCYEKGVCYPPATATFHINGSGVFHPDEAPKKNNHSSLPFTHQAQDTHTNTAEENEFDLNWTSLLTFLAAGVALSFTACLYPLLPILSSIIVGNHQTGLNKTKGFLLSFVYVQGLALAYTVVGVVAGLTGALLTLWLQQPAVILSAAALMVLLALGMFDVIPIQMPSMIQQYLTDKNQTLSGGKLGSIFLMGLFSALIVGPCVAPPLAVALGYIGQTQDALLGGALLYMMALGMGLPLLLIGTFGGHILPKSGAWMNTIRHFFGLIILGLAIYMSSPFMPVWLATALYLALAALTLIFLAKKILESNSLKIKLFFSLVFLLLLILTGFFSVHGIQKNNTPVHRLLNIHFKHAEPNQKFTNVTEFTQKITQLQQQSPDKPVVVDFYADWCIACQEMETQTFSQNSVQTVLAQDYQFVQIDVTGNKPEYQALMKEYGIFGPPAVFVLSATTGKPYGKPLIGFADEQAFLVWLKQSTPP